MLFVCLLLVSKKLIPNILLEVLQFLVINIINFSVEFSVWCRIGGQFLYFSFFLFFFLHVYMQKIPSIGETIISPLYILCSFIIIYWPYKVEFISEFWILFQWSMCQFFYQYDSILLITVLKGSLEIESMMHPALLFFLKMALALWVL